MKKIKKKSIGFIIFSLILSIILLLVLGFFLLQCYKLSVFPERLLFVIGIALLLICIIVEILLLFYSRNIFSKIINSVLALCLIFGSVVGSIYVLKTRNMLSNITTQTGKNKNVISVIANDGKIDNIDQLTGKNIGILKGINEEGTKNCLADIKKELKLGEEDELPFSLTEIATVTKLAMDLINYNVDAILLNEAYRPNIEDMTSLSDFSNQTNVIFQSVYYTDDINEPLAVSNITSEPFMIYVSGNDTYGDVGEVSRSDVNMVVVVNPITSTVLLVSLPRDCYLPQICDEGDACLYGSYDKLTHVGLHGVNASKRTVESALNIEVNYTFRVNFDSVINIVNSIGGITVNVPAEAACDDFYTAPGLGGAHEGENFFDGNHALAFARERYSYNDGDNQRVRNQQMVLKAIFNRCTSPEVLPYYANFLEALGGAFETTLSQNEITDLIKYQIQQMPEWEFKSYQVKGYGDMLLSAEMGTEVSVIVPYEETLVIAHDKIMAVLEGKDPDEISDPDFLQESNTSINTSDNGYYDNYYQYYDISNNENFEYYEETVNDDNEYFEE